MFGKITLKVDVSEFQKAIKAYREASHKSIAPILNGAMSDILKEVADNAPKAERGEIKGLPETLGKVWWAIVTKKLMKSGATLFYKKTKKREARRESIAGKGWFDSRQHFFTNAQRAKLSKQMLAGRLRSIGFARSALYKALGAFRSVGGSKTRPDLTKATGAGIKATTTSKKSSFVCHWEIGKGNATRLKETLEGLFDVAIANKTQNIKARTEAKLKQLAQSLGGKVS
jgi:hypothetical protein